MRLAMQILKLTALLYLIAIDEPAEQRIYNPLFQNCPLWAQIWTLWIQKQTFRFRPKYGPKLFLWLIPEADRALAASVLPQQRKRHTLRLHQTGG